MPEKKPGTELNDSLTVFPGGVNMGVAPLLLPKTQLAFARDATVRGTQVTHRSTYQQIPLSGAVIPVGLFQGAGYYQPDSGLECLIASVAGRIYQLQISGNTATVIDVTPAAANSTTLPQTWMWQSEKWLNIENGQDVPILFDGTSCRRAKTGVEIVGTKDTAAGVPFPDIGKTVNIGLAAAYQGQYNITVQVVYQRGTQPPLFLGSWQVLPANTPNPGAPFPNATIHNTSGVNNPISAGTAVVRQTTSNQTVVWGSTSTSGATFAIAAGSTFFLNFTNAYPGSNGDTIYLGSGQQYRVLGGAGTTQLELKNLSTFATSIGDHAAAARVTSVVTNQTVGIVAVASAFGIGSTVNVVMQQPYTGPVTATVFINGLAATISPFTQTNSDLTITLLNINQNPINPDTGTRYTFLSNNASPPSTTTLQSLPEIPTGKMGAYVRGRNWVCLADGASYWASDLVGESSGTTQYNFRDAVLSSRENNYIAGGGTFRVPGSPADIRAIIGTTQLDASLGQGPLAVATPNVVYSNNAPTDRSTWASLTFPIQSESLISNGATGQWSTVAANGDTIMRSLDGIRSLLMARRDFDVWGNVPQSREVGPILAQDSLALLNFESLIVFDNRALLACNPVQTAYGVYHPNIIALDFDTLSGLQGKEPAVYDGVWTGLNVLQLVKGTFQGIERAFAFHLNLATNAIELWEIQPTGASIYDNGTTPITLRIEGPSMYFGQRGDDDPSPMELWDGEIAIDQMIGPVTFKVWYKPDQYPNWVPWLKWTETPDPTTTPNFRPRMGLTKPTLRNTDPSTNRPLPYGYTFQTALEITGHCRVTAIRLEAHVTPESGFAKSTTGATNDF